MQEMPTKASSRPRVPPLSMPKPIMVPSSVQSQVNYVYGDSNTYSSSNINNITATSNSNLSNVNNMELVSPNNQVNTTASAQPTYYAYYNDNRDTTNYYHQQHHQEEQQEYLSQQQGNHQSQEHQHHQSQHQQLQLYEGQSHEYANQNTPYQQDRTSVRNTWAICATCSSYMSTCKCQHCTLCHSAILTLNNVSHCDMCRCPLCANCCTNRWIWNYITRESKLICDACAVPMGMLYAIHMMDDYAMLGLTSNCSTMSRPSYTNLTMEYNGQDLFSSHEQEVMRNHHGSTTLSHGTLHWGLYVLWAVMETPRRCVNPSCSCPFMFSYVCRHCQLPTVTCAWHEVRNAPGHVIHDVELRSLVMVMEAAVREQLKNKQEYYQKEEQMLQSSALVNNTNNTISQMITQTISELPCTEYERTFRNNISLYAERNALGIRGNTALSSSSFTSPLSPSSHHSSRACHDKELLRKVCLASVASAIANEHRATPNISLALSDVFCAHLLEIVRVESTYTMYHCTNTNMTFIAFPSYPALLHSLTPYTFSKCTQCDVWPTQSVVQQNSQQQSNLYRQGSLGVVRRANWQNERSVNMTNNGNSQNYNYNYVEHQQQQPRTNKRITSFYALDSVVSLFEQSSSLQELYNEIVNILHSGAVLVLCGHAIGGALASYLTSLLLIEHTPLCVANRLTCITFGAPLFASCELGTLLNTSQYASFFQHFVHACDVVPRFSLLSTYLILGRKLCGLPAAEEVDMHNMDTTVSSMLHWIATQHGIAFTHSEHVTYNDTNAYVDDNYTNTLNDEANLQTTVNNSSIDENNTARTKNGTSKGKSSHFRPARLFSKSTHSTLSSSAPLTGAAATSGGHLQKKYNNNNGNGNDSNTTNSTSLFSQIGVGHIFDDEEGENEYARLTETRTGDIFARSREPFANDRNFESVRFLRSHYRSTVNYAPFTEDVLRHESFAKGGNATCSVPHISESHTIHECNTDGNENKVSTEVNLYPFGEYHLLYTHNWLTESIELERNKCNSNLSSNKTVENKKQLLKMYSNYEYCSNPGEVVQSLSIRSHSRVLLRDHLISSYIKALTYYINSLE